VKILTQIIQASVSWSPVNLILWTEC